MKNKRLFGYTLLLSGLVLGTSVYATKAEPGSEGDPIVTKSYVDSQIGTYKKTIDDLTVQVLDLKEQLQADENDTATSNTGYELLTIPKGGMLVGEQGTEFIVRAGNGTIVAGGGGGLQDLTDGVDLPSGSNAKKYHLLLIPRADGRGVLAESELIVMIRGGYTIQ